MTTLSARLVVRLLTADHRLLGWVAHEARVRGDGMLRAAAPVVIPVEENGVPAWVSWHWCDVHAEVRVPVAVGEPVRVGESYTVAQANDPVVVLGAPREPLPPVTVRREHAVAVPAGVMGGRG